MSDKTTVNCGGGCGCLSLILGILILWALWFGLPTPWGKYNVDIFPPRIWIMEETLNQ